MGDAVVAPELEQQSLEEEVKLELDVRAVESFWKAFAILGNSSVDLALFRLLLPSTTVVHVGQPSEIFLL